MIGSIPQTALKVLLMAIISVALARTDVYGQTNTRSAPAQSGAMPDRQQVKQKKLPYRGKLAAVDKTARSFTVGKRTFYVTAETKLSKNSQPLRLDQLVVGDLLTGSYIKNADGKLLAATVYVGGKNAETKSKEAFAGVLIGTGAFPRCENGHRSTSPTDIPLNATAATNWFSSYRPWCRFVSTGESGTGCERTPGPCAIHRN